MLAEQGARLSKEVAELASAVKRLRRCGFQEKSQNATTVKDSEDAMKAVSDELTSSNTSAAPVILVRLGMIMAQPSWVSGVCRARLV
jgi:hypothetical protein